MKSIFKMKGLSKIAILIIIFSLLAAGFWFYFIQRSAKPQLELQKLGNMKLVSPVFENNQYIPQKYTCDGEDINPPLEISDVPENARSLALIMDDPDAPMGTWVHWLLWNISSDTSTIEENSVPEGAVQGMNSFGKQPYGGPCPPSGTHHYYFKLYALDKELDLASSSEKKEVETAMEGHILDTAELIGLYQRQ